MNKTIGLQLVVYSLVLAGLSYFAYELAPAQAQPTLIAGVAGGALCLIWGVWAVAGNERKAPCVLTLIPVNFILMGQTILGWSGGSQGMRDHRAAAIVITLLFALSIGMLVRVAWAGVVLDGQAAGGPKEGGVKSQTTEKPAEQGHGVKRG